MGSTPSAVVKRSGSSTRERPASAVAHPAGVRGTEVALLKADYKAQLAELRAAVADLQEQLEANESTSSDFLQLACELGEARRNLRKLQATRRFSHHLLTKLQAQRDQAQRDVLQLRRELEEARRALARSAPAVAPASPAEEAPSASPARKTLRFVEPSNVSARPRKALLPIKCGTHEAQNPLLTGKSKPKNAVTRYSILGSALTPERLGKQRTSLSSP